MYKVRLRADVGAFIAIGQSYDGVISSDKNIIEKQQVLRWKQRFDNYQRALGRLQTAISLAGSRELSELEKQGLIKVFEFTHELAWNTLKDFLTERDMLTLHKTYWGITRENQPAAKSRYY